MPNSRLTNFALSKQNSLVDVAVLNSELGGGLGLQKLSWTNFCPSPLLRLSPDGDWRVNTVNLSGESGWLLFIKPFSWSSWELWSEILGFTVDVCNHEPSLVLIKSVFWISLVVNTSILFVEKPLLTFIILNILLNKTPLSWPFCGLIILLSGKNKVKAGVVWFPEMENNALVWLHGSRFWLSILLFGIKVFFGWLNIAVYDFNIKINIRVLWNPVISKWRLDLSTSVYQMSWAMKSGFSSLVQLWEGKIPALDDFIGAEVECFWSSIGCFEAWIGDYAAVIQVTFPGNGSPWPVLAFFTFSFFGNVYSKFCHV